MIQVWERKINDEGKACAEWEFGPGQEIETDMARLEGLKIFRIKQGSLGSKIMDPTRIEALTKWDLKNLRTVVERWYENNRADMEIETVETQCTHADSKICAPFARE